MAMPEPAAAGVNPGVKDQTTAEAAIDPNVVAAPQSVEAGVAAAREAANPQDPNSQQATPEEQAEYDRANEALHQVLYGKDKTSQAVVDMLQPEDKVGSTVKAGVLLITQLDKKLDMDEAIIAEITSDVADRLIELGERAKGMEFSEQEAQAVLGATWEGVLEVFGVGPEDYEELTRGMSPEDIKEQTRQYRGFLGE